VTTGGTPFSVDVERGDPSVVRVHGDVDVSCASSLAACLDDVLATSDRVVIDLGGVSFMDSMGLNTLVRARQRADGYGHELELRHLDARLQRLLQLTGLDRLFPSSSS
jgi:anti-anti-sigma factor